MMCNLPVSVSAIYKLVCVHHAAGYTQARGKEEEEEEAVLPSSCSLALPVIRM